MLKRLAMITLGILILATPWAFAYGPLFPWSVIKPGYETLELKRADVYYPTGAKLEAAYRQVDEYLSEAERFHRLTFHRRIRVIACANWSDFTRFSPTTRGRAVAAATLETGTVIYVSPKIAERRLDLAEFLRHEISHAILHQNTRLLPQLRLRHRTWFYEGVPVWFGRQQAYLTQPEFLQRAKTADFARLFAFDANAWSPPALDMRFAYVAWRDFLDYLVQQRGRGAFHQFFDSIREDAAQFEESFAVAFGKPMPEMIADFQQAIRSGAYQPR